MKAFGLTGGIGTGKSTAGEILHQRAVAVVDTDVIARQLVEPGRPALAEIAAAFGSRMLDAAGRLRRDELARQVFADESARRQLEGILHPRIRAAWQAQLQTWHGEGRAAAVVVIPLLFETDAAAYFDATICLACTAATQRQRLQSRGWPPEQIEQRVKVQLPMEKKMALADFVVWTEGSLEALQGQLARIIPCP